MKPTNHLLGKSFLICLVVYIICTAFAYFTLLILPEEISPLWKAAIADFIATVVVFVFSVAYKNSSLYDPYWSVAPPLIAFYWMSSPSTNTKAAHYHMLFVISIWAIRLTLNWAKGWQGLAHEDWRYKMLHDKNPSIYWLTNFGGIHLFPTIMVFLGMIPVFYFIEKAEGISFISLLGSAIAILATAIEYIADEQMRDFKKKAKPTQFIDEGLWRFSRHPNYFGEVLFWFGLWIMAVGVNFSLWFTAVGWLAMLALFLFVSIPMMEEKNTINKTGYEDYQKKVSVFIPWFRKQD